MSIPNDQYDPLIPRRLDALSDSQQDMLINFRNLDAAFKKNHVGFYSETQTNEEDQGKHVVVQLFAGPIRQTKSDETNLYTKNVADSLNTADKIPQLFMRIQNTTEFQFTAYQNVPTTSSNTYTFMPGGYILYFGIVKSVSGKSTVTLNPKPKKIVYAGANANNDTGQSFPLAANVNNTSINFFWAAGGTASGRRNYNGNLSYTIIGIY